MERLVLSVEERRINWYFERQALQTNPSYLHDAVTAVIQEVLRQTSSTSCGSDHI